MHILLLAKGMRRAVLLVLLQQTKYYQQGQHINIWIA